MYTNRNNAEDERTVYTNFESQRTTESKLRFLNSSFPALPTTLGIHRGRDHGPLRNIVSFTIFGLNVAVLHHSVQVSPHLTLK